LKFFSGKVAQRGFPDGPFGRKLAGEREADAKHAERRVAFHVKFEIV